MLTLYTGGITLKNHAMPAVVAAVNTVSITNFTPLHINFISLSNPQTSQDDNISDEEYEAAVSNIKDLYWENNDEEEEDAQPINVNVVYTQDDKQPE
ncbi:hypothetical protein Clacol_004480 [Clathrus columnatus]|uniref:Uncharacterized protein n=1 Tax=Clathrus columnatus TaxID=1419009 RepID=A0AAV5AC10_9AGAM|nr:hypothetical protein Clacol_004480 [Clathrus columnatus]